MRLTLCILFVCMFLCIPARGTETLVFYSEENPPLNYTNQDTGEFTGAATELIREIMRQTDIPYTIVVKPWRRAYRSVQQERNACLFGTVWSVDRQPIFTWAGPLFVGGWAIYQQKGANLDVRSLADLKGHRVSAREGTAAIARLAAESEAEIITAPRDDMAAALLYRNRSDLWLSGVFAAAHSASRAGVPLPDLAFIWKPSKVMLACNKEFDPTILEQLNSVNNTLDTLRDQLMENYSYGAALKK